MAPTKTAGLSVRAFLDHVSSETSARLDAQGMTADQRRRWTMLQISFGSPKIHFEVWVQPARGQIEVGLHFEADPDLNAWLMQRFADDMLAVRDELGSDYELEQWTKRWGRIHAYVPYDKLDGALADEVASRLTAAVTCLQPRLETHLSERPPVRRAARGRR